MHPLSDSAIPPVNRERFRWLASYYDAQIQFTECFVLAMLEDARHLSEAQGVPLSVHTYRAVRSARGHGHAPAGTGHGGAGPAGDCGNDGPSSFQPAAIVNATCGLGGSHAGSVAGRVLPVGRGHQGQPLSHASSRLGQVLRSGGVYAEASDGRPIFLLPFGSLALVGTTDLPIEADPETVTADEEELQYLLRAACDVFPHIALTRRDVDFHYCGVRPLPQTASAETSSVTRRHILHVHDDPDVSLISIIGGKLTTCRSLAEETAQLVLKRLGIPLQKNSRDRGIPGGEEYPTSRDVRAGMVHASRERTGIDALAGRRGMAVVRHACCQPGGCRCVGHRIRRRQRQPCRHTSSLGVCSAGDAGRVVPHIGRSCRTPIDVALLARPDTVRVSTNWPHSWSSRVCWRQNRKMRKSGAASTG